MLARLAPRLQELGWTVQVLSLRRPGEVADALRDAGVEVVSLDLPAGMVTPGGLLRLHGVMRRFRPDVLLGWMYHGNLVAGLARLMRPRARLVLAIRKSLDDFAGEKWHTRLVIRLHPWLARLAEAVIYNSSHGRVTHVARIGAAAKARVIPNGFDLSRLYPDEKARAAVRAELGLADGDKAILLPGRHTPEKDHGTFLRAAAQLCEKRADVRFYLCGPGITADNEALSALVPEAIRERVYMLGARADMAALYNAADILTLSSRTEGFPNVLGEAMACGTPCVATRVGDVAEVLGEQGVVVSPRDPSALVAGWEHMLEMSETQRDRLAQGARRRVEQRYSLAAVAARFDALLRGRQGETDS